MSYRDCAHHYEEQDDPPEAEPVELVTGPCPVCGKPVTFPAGSHFEEDGFCSRTCFHAFGADRQADYDRVMEQEAAAYEASLVELPCVICSRPVRVLPDAPDYDQLCSADCRRHYVERVTEDCPPYDGNDMPL